MVEGYHEKMQQAVRDAADTNPPLLAALNEAPVKAAIDRLAQSMAVNFVRIRDGLTDAPYENGACPVEEAHDGVIAALRAHYQETGDAARRAVSDAVTVYDAVSRQKPHLNVHTAGAQILEKVKVTRKPSGHSSTLGS